MNVDLLLDRPTRVYSPGEMVSGFVVIRTPQELAHNGIVLTGHGQLALQLAARQVGLLESFSNSQKPQDLFHTPVQILGPGSKLPAGETKLPFHFELKADDGKVLFETYHGVYVNCQYSLTVEVARRGLSKAFSKSMELIVAIPDDSSLKSSSEVQRMDFKLAPEHLQMVGTTRSTSAPDFLVEGHFSRTTCVLSEPFSGDVTVQHTTVPVKSIELQFVRVETVSHDKGDIREATEVQNIQIASGAVCPKLAIPIHMVFPRLFTCKTTITKAFKVEFEVNVVILLEDDHMVTLNMPITILR